MVIHPQIQQVPGAPDHICGIMLYERTPVVFCRLGDSGGCTCGFILGLRDGTMIGVIGEPGAEDSGEPEKMMEVMPGIWEKNVIRLNDREFCEIVGYIRDNYGINLEKSRC